MTTYVLREQNDWFEDEIRFIREIIEPDTLFVDVGANYGLYTLSAARLCRQGRVWSYEPCSTTVRHLERSLEINQFQNVKLVQEAVSSKPGWGCLQNNEQSELNTLVESGKDAHGERVALTTLDAEAEEYGWAGVDIIKIDAEGHELRVLEGGKNFFSSASPLVMCEIKAGSNLDLTAAQWLIKRGYQTYRLVPGLGILASQDIGAKIDGYQLNIFCCKPDRADQLFSKGRLAHNSVQGSHLVQESSVSWRDYVSSFPYGKANLDSWLEKIAASPANGWPDYQRALDLYAVSRLPNEAITDRYAALQACYLSLGQIVNQAATVPRLLSYARAAADLGARENAVQALGFLLRSVSQRREELIAGEPFLPPCEEFEQVEPGQGSYNWAVAAALHSFETLRSHSGYFSHPETTLQIANQMKQLGFNTSQMATRAELARGRMQLGA